MTDFWNLDWPTRSPMFEPVRQDAARLPHVGWPDAAVLNALADTCGRRIVNANGQRVRFVPQDARPKDFADRFEPRAFLRGEVMVRPCNWHDLLNALVWLRFPVSKAALNARQFAALSAQTDGRRSPEGDALTAFDEDGIVVLSSDAGLLELVQQFRWKALFWERREAVRARMRFLVFGHALYEKALAPFVGMTAKALMFEVPERVLSLETDALAQEADRLVALRLMQPGSLPGGRALAPVPLLGVPGWWADNESAVFYDNTAYFRPGRAGAADQAPSSSIS
jgi:hypothetical protein